MGTLGTPPADFEIQQRPTPFAEALLVVGLAILIPLAYAYHVNHVWEDFFISFRHSQNLCEGNGLTYNADERLHGFTSPLGTLLPAACNYVTGQQSYLPSLLLYRVLTISAFAGGAIFLFRTLWRLNASLLTRLGVLALYLTEVKGVEFTTDGMETAFMLFFVAWSLYLFVVGWVWNWSALGLCWAGFMWTRPDGCVYIVVFVLANLVFGREPRRLVIAAAIKGGLLGAALYLPWFAGAWFYYGSPIPHTFLAKSNQSDGTLAHLVAVAGDILPRYGHAAARAFLPIYQFFDPKAWIEGQRWTEIVLIAPAKWLGLFASVYWLLPVADRFGRMASLAFVVLCLYLSTHLWYFPWYFPPVALLGNVVLVRGIVALSDAIGIYRPDDPLYSAFRRLPAAVILVLVLRQLGLFAYTWHQMTIQDRVIEMGHRRVIGEWLSARVKPNESVYLEPFGYIGYFSKARIVDWPGLVSPEVVRLRREQKADMVGVASALRPDWMVLRPDEASAMSGMPFFDEYALAKRFDAEPELAKYNSVPGPNWLRFDAKLDVYKRVVTGPGERKLIEVPFSAVPTRIIPGDKAPTFYFALPKPTKVVAIRLRFSYDAANAPAHFIFSWESEPAASDPGANSLSWVQRAAPGERTRLIWIDGNLTGFRITPDDKPSGFRLKEITFIESQRS